MNLYTWDFLLITHMVLDHLMVTVCPLEKAGNQVGSLLRKPELIQLEQNKQVSQGDLSRNITQQASIPVGGRESCSEQVWKGLQWWSSDITSMSGGEGALYSEIQSNGDMGPLSPVNRQTDRHDWKHYFPKLQQ